MAEGRFPSFTGARVVASILSPHYSHDLVIWNPLFNFSIIINLLPEEEMH
jgi:hypothetical protein